MFKTINGINFIILIYSIKTNNWALLITTIFIFLIVSAWYLDHIELISLKQKYNNLPTKQQLHSKIQEYIKYPNMSWYQKIISIRAFIAGAEYILNKFK
jgi:hypothetical protein